MHLPFLIADVFTGVQYRPTVTRLAELSLAPLPTSWEIAKAIHEYDEPVWAMSLANAPVETVSAITSALEDLILSTPDLLPPALPAPCNSRGDRHLTALINLWTRMGDALPDGLSAIRHILQLPHRHFLSKLSIVEGSLDACAPASLAALYKRLHSEFGSVPSTATRFAAAKGTRLNACQAGLLVSDLETGPADYSMNFYGLRDVSVCADFAAARARSLIEAGAKAQDIAVLAADDLNHIVRAFTAQGVPLSGLPDHLPERDLLGELALQLLLAKRPPTPAMVLASIALSPLLPWSAQTGRDLAETVMGGDFRGEALAPVPEHKELWDDIRSSASSLAQLRFYTNRICSKLPQGDALTARLSIPLGEGSPDWEILLRSVQIKQSSVSDPVRNVEGVSLWSAHESPWRSCRHLIVSDFTEGLYPLRPRANPLFLDSEIITIREKMGFQLHGRAERLEQNMALFDQQLRAVSESVAFLIPWRDYSGGRLAPSTGLPLIARAFDNVEDASGLIQDLSSLEKDEWPVPYHLVTPNPEPSNIPEEIIFPDHGLLSLRLRDDGTAKPQSPSKLETLLVSPLTWLLGEINAVDMSWSAEELDILAKGSIAHDVFEHAFPAGEVPRIDELRLSVEQAYDRALARHASFLRNATWEMERDALQREILQSAERWREHLIALGAKIIGNEVWLSGKVQGIELHGKADAILGLPDDTLLVVDHKKSGSTSRRKRMQAGWDLQAGLYRDMIQNPTRRDGDAMGELIGRKVGIAYHLMDDGGLLTSGYVPGNGSPARDMGDDINDGALAKLAERLSEIGAGRVVLNTTADESFFRREANFIPYALTDGSALVTAFIRPAEEDR